MIRWPCLCLVCWSHSQEFLRKAQSQKAGKKISSMNQACSVHWFFQPPTKSPGFNPLKGPHWLQAHQNGFRCGVRGSATEKALGIPMGYLHWWQRNGLHRTKNKWHSVKRKIIRYYHTYLYINCDHIAVFDLYPMVEIVGGRMLGCPTFNPCHPCPNLVDMRYIEIHYRSLYTMPPCLLLRSVKSQNSIRIAGSLVTGLAGFWDSRFDRHVQRKITEGMVLYSMSLPTFDHPPQ